MPVNSIPDGEFTFRYPVLPSNAPSSPSPVPSDVSMDVPSDPAGNHVPEKDIPFTKLVKDTLELIDKDLDFEMLRLSLCGLTDEATLKIVHDLLRKSPFCRVRRFYGNIVGISPRIMASGSLTLDTTPSWGHSLPNDVHVTHSWVDQEGTRTELVHTMSNLRVGTFSKDSFLYILLPRLSSSAHTPQGLTSRQFRDVWDLAIGLAAEAINENDSSFTIRSQDLERFSRLVRSIADENHLDWFQDFSFVHVVRSKSSPHYFDAESRCDALIKYLVRHNMSILDLARDEDNGGHWFVDTGLMITHQEKSVVWSTSAHAAVIRSLFGVEYSDDQYERELFSHLTDASCARVRCHEAASVDPTRPTYIELTVNDEVFQATDERGVPLDRITALHFVRRPARHSTPLDLLFHDYSDKDTKISSVVSATMRIHDCLEVLTDFDPQVLFESCLVFKPRDIWWWRALRVYALDLVIELQRRDGRGLSVLGQDAQLLTAAVPWLVSTLHRGVIDPLSNGRLPFPASSTRGAIFLHDIELPNLDLDGEIPFFKDLSPVYYMEEEALVRYLGASVGTIVHSFVHPDLPIVPNHAREQPSPNGPREFAFTIFRFKATSRASFFLPAPIDSELRALENAPDIMNVDSYITAIVNFTVVQNFFADILDIAPPAVVQLPITRSIADRDIFLREDLGGVFRAVRWKHASMTEWHRAFRRFFPPFSSIRERKHSPFQHCRYFLLWISLPRVLSPYSFAVLRRAVWVSFFRDLVWIPHCSKNRIWETRRDDPPPHILRSPSAPDVAAAHILINAPQPPAFEMLE